MNGYYIYIHGKQHSRRRKVIMVIKDPHCIYFEGISAYVFYVDETKEGEECIIYDLFVTNKYRNQGKGTWLVKEALRQIFNAGYNKAFVVVGDKTLISFYEKLGFVQTSEKEMYYYKEKGGK